MRAWRGGWSWFARLGRVRQDGPASAGRAAGRRAPRPRGCRWTQRTRSRGRAAVAPGRGRGTAPARGSAPARSSLAGLAARTEGWAARLQLLRVLATRDAQLSRRSTGSHRVRHGPWPRVPEERTEPPRRDSWPWPNGCAAGSPRPNAPRVQRHRVARDRPAHADRVGLLRAGADPARPGPSGRGRADLRAGPAQPGHVRPAAASRLTELHRAGRDRLPAGRTRPRPPACHRGHRAVPPVRLHPAGPPRWPTAWPRWR